MPKNIEIHPSNGSHICSNRSQKDNITLHNSITFLVIFPYIFHSNSTDQYQKIRSNKTTCFGNIIWNRTDALFIDKLIISRK